MSRVWTGIFGCAALACALPALAQYPGRVDTNQPSDTVHLRATAVLEYTGDLKGTEASRLVPIAVWDGTQYQPGGLYLAQPAPLAVLSGTQYELETDGQPKGFFNIRDAEDIGGLWVGVGAFEAPKPLVARSRRTQPSHVYEVGGNDPGKPHFAHVPPEDQSETASSGSGSAGASESEGPTLHQRTGAGSGSQTDVDDGRPTFHRRPASDQATSRQAVDPDRPTMEYASPNEGKLDKPDALMGFPPGMKQMVAVSDANPTGGQTFSYVWASPDDEAKMKADLEAVAEQALAPPAAAVKPAVVKTAHGAHRKAQPAPPAPPQPMLEDVEFRSFGLTFGGGATMVLSAHTAGDDPNYVTIIAQPDFYGKPQVLLKQVTSANDLDVIPRMRLIDAVDTEGNSRGNLIFELRGHTYRRFAIYRIAGGQATQVFLSQPAPIV